MDSVFKRAAKELEEQHDVVLVTIVASAGSAPRKTGSHMLVGTDGRLAGTIGGGNIEYQSDLKARGLLAEKRSCLHSFFLNEKDEEGLGMVCGGDVDVLFQCIPHASGTWREIAHLLADAAAGTSGWLVLSLSGADPCLLSDQKELLAGSMPDDVDALCSSSCVQAGGFFSMPVRQKERAVIFGGGHIAQALVPILASVDFEPTVLDNRPEFADPALFPCAENVILGDYLAIADHLTLHADDYAVVMTHGHAHDLAVEAQLLRHELAYVGVVGSARKTHMVRERLRSEGISEDRIASVHMPVGTKIGAVTPAEIAVSIAGEMIAMRAERRAASS